MAHSLLISDERVFAKDLSKIAPKRVRAIMQQVALLQHEPWPDGIHVKKLQDFDLADFRLRIGEYRVLFDRDLEKKVVILYRVLHRSKSYR